MTGRVHIDTLVRGSGPLTKKQVAASRRWVEEDWQSHDVDREVIVLISRLIATVEFHQWTIEGMLK